MAGFFERYPSIRGADLCEGISGEDTERMLSCIGAFTREYGPGELIDLWSGESAKIGIVGSGQVRVSRIDAFGNRTILFSCSPGMTFGEAAACAGDSSPSTEIEAVRRSTIVLIDISRAVTTCGSACAFHSRLVRNMLGVLARGSIALSRRIEILSSRSTRAKIIAFLNAEAVDRGAASFTLKMTRDELADTLAVNRSAMCTELSRMKRDGIIDFQGSHFTLLKNS